MPANKSAHGALKAVDAAAGEPDLTLVVNNRKVAKPGEYFPKQDAQTAPELVLGGSLDKTATYLVVGLDMDAPFPWFTRLGPIIHWIQHDLKADATTGVLRTAAPWIVDYIGPAPPPGSGPHRYCFFLYKQPPNFRAEKFALAGLGNPVANTKRLWYDLDALEKDAGLQQVAACNYFKSN